MLIRSERGQGRARHRRTQESRRTRLDNTGPRSHGRADYGGDARASPTAHRGSRRDTRTRVPRGRGPHGGRRMKRHHAHSRIARRAMTYFRMVFLNSAVGASRSALCGAKTTIKKQREDLWKCLFYLSNIAGFVDYVFHFWCQSEIKTEWDSDLE